MKLIEKKTVCTVEMSELERLILMGLISKVLNKEPLDLDQESKEKLAEILYGLSSSNLG